MSDEFQYDVFLSHNKLDKPRVRRLAERLRAAGLRVWFDEWVIKPGDDIFLAIERGLEATRTLALCLSPAALGSDWVNLERSTVLFRDPANADRRFIPLLLADCKLPDTLRRYKYVDFRSETDATWAEVLRICQAGVGDTGATTMVAATTAVTSEPPPDVIRIRAKLNCEESLSNVLHLRPAQFIARLCKQFPHSEFRILRNSGKQDSLGEGVDPKSLMQLTTACFVHGAEVTIAVTGKCRVMAAEFLRIAWENLGNYSEDVPSARQRLTRLIDEAFNRTIDPDVPEFGQEAVMSAPDQHVMDGEECRAVAIINDRLHNLSLPIIPLIAKPFESRTTIAFEDPSQGIYWFTMGPENGFELDDRIMEIPIEVGTRITVLTSGPNRSKTNESIKSVLESLWECDEWLRRNAFDLNDDATVSELLNFVATAKRPKGSEFAYVHNPSLSTLLAPKRVFVNSSTSEFSKQEVFDQLIAPHLSMHGLERAVVSSHAKDVVVREGFALIHAALERAPRISMTLGVYPKGVAWDDDGKRVTLVCMFIFAKDTYRTWLDYMRKMAIVLRENPGLREQLTWAQDNEHLLTVLRQAETGTVT